MEGVLAVVAIVAFFAVVLSGLAWLVVRVRRRGGGESLMQPFDEIWRPTAHHARQQIEERRELRTESPAPGDPPADPASGVRPAGDTHRRSNPPGRG